jgi:hypothetical protein
MWCAVGRSLPNRKPRQPTTAELNQMLAKVMAQVAAAKVAAATTPTPAAANAAVLKEPVTLSSENVALLAASLTESLTASLTESLKSEIAKLTTERVSLSHGSPTLDGEGVEGEQRIMTAEFRETGTVGTRNR